MVSSKTDLLRCSAFLHIRHAMLFCLIRNNALSLVFRSFGFVIP